MSKGPPHGEVDPALLFEFGGREVWGVTMQGAKVRQLAQGELAVPAIYLYPPVEDDEGEIRLSHSPSKAVPISCLLPCDEALMEWPLKPPH